MKITQIMVISKMQGNLPNSPMSDAVLSPAGVPASPGDELESLSLAEQRLFHLQRQLDIETKVERFLVKDFSPLIICRCVREPRIC